MQRVLLLLVLLIAASAPSGVRTQTPDRQNPPLAIPEEARAGLELLYQGDTRRATALFRTLQAHQPDHPLGYLLEANAVWWERWCGSLEMKPWGFVDAAAGVDSPLDSTHRALVAAAQQRAEALRKPAPPPQLRGAEAHFYQGMAYAMEGRLAALRRENRAAASAGKKMRAALLRARQLNPQLDDALFGLGLYNYYVDTLSPLVKLLRVLLFIPGGDKRTGLVQLDRAAAGGVLVATEARFWLAKNLRNYDQDFARARVEFQRLGDRYPQNPIFPLLVAGVAAKLGDRAGAARAYTRARNLARATSPCDQRVAELATTGLKLLSGPSSK